MRRIRAWAVCSLLCVTSLPAQFTRLPRPVATSDNPVPPAPPIGKAVVSGKVVNAKTQAPVKKARVSLNGPVSLNAVTDASGSFTFRALPPGNYFVMANHDDFASDPRQGDVPQNFTVGEEGETSGIEIKLKPAASITGRVLDEDDGPLPGCSVSALRFDHLQRPPRMIGTNGASSDNQGVYRLGGLQPGRYVLKAQCQEFFPAPHGFMHLNDPLVPHEGYLEVTYGAGDSGSPAAGFRVGAGAEITGIDFHTKRVPVYAVRGTVSGVDASLLGGATILLRREPSLPGDNSAIGAARFDPSRGRFRFQNITAGTYELTATVFNTEHVYAAHQIVEVGKAPVTNAELRLEPGVALSGAIEYDDAAVRFDNMQLSLVSLDPDYRGPQPAATITKDNTFEFKSILPGHFRLNRLPIGYVKSITIGGREVSPSDFELGASAAGEMRVSVGSKTAKVEVEVTPKIATGQTVSVVLLPFEGVVSSPDSPLIGMAQGDVVEVNSVPPGKYRAIAVESGNPWLVLMAGPQALAELENHMVPVELSEGDTKKISATLVTAKELQKALEAAE